MQIKVTKKMGDADVEFQFDGEDIRECLHKSAFLFWRDECPLDGFKGRQIYYDVREMDSDNGKFIFVNRKCKAEDGRIASSKLGERKGGKGFFWNDWEIYTPERETVDF